MLHSSPASALFLPLFEKVKEAILGAWANYASTLTDGTTSTTTAHGLDAAQRLFAEASSAFSLDDGVAAARAEVGSALQGLDMKRRLTIVQELLDRASPDDIKFGSENMSNYMEGIVATLCDVAGVRVDKDKIADITTEHDKFFALVAKGTARPHDFLQLERVTDTLRRLDALQHIGNRRSLMHVVANTCELTRTVAPDCDELRNSGSTEIASGIKALSAKTAATIKDCEPKQEILQSATTLSEAALVIQKAYETSCSDALLASLVVAMKGVADIGGTYLGDGLAWHAGVAGDGDKEFKKVCGLATEVYKHVEVPRCELGYFALDGRRMPGHREPQGQRSRHPSRCDGVDGHIILVRMHLIGHIMNDNNKDILRSKVVT